MQKGGIFEILRDIYEGNKVLIHSEQQPKKKKKNLKSEIRIGDHGTESIPVKETIKNPAFLYIQLDNIINLPRTDNSMQIRLTHTEHRVTRISEAMPPTNAFDIEETDKPTFTMRIEQDSMVELTNFSDNPLTITLYERVQPHGGEEEEAHSVASDHTQTKLRRNELKPVAVGFIDLLEFFCNKRVTGEVTSFLYVINKDSASELGATKTVWNIYTLLPLLKQIMFCNLIFMTLESIYNPPLELLEQHEQLVVQVSIRMKTPNEQGVYKQALLCDYCTLNKKIIGEQNTTHRWENLERTNADKGGLSTCTDTKVSHNELFQELLGTEGVNFRYNEINIHEDAALSFYSMHRFVLTEATSTMLHEAIAFNQYELLVEVINVETGQSIMWGTLDPAVFLYPNVNSCRFAVELQPKEDKQPDPSKGRKTPDPTKGKKTKGLSNAPSNPIFMPPKPTFAVFNICLLSPITAPPTRISLLHKNELKRKALKTCTKIEAVPPSKPISEFCGLSYKAADDIVAALAKYIMTKEITETTNHRGFFCCQLKNMQAIWQKLIACDFNRRIPTKNNVEFRNLMTVVYQELEKRMYDFIQRCAGEGMNRCLFSLSEEDNRTQIIRSMNQAKLLQEVGNEEAAQFLFNKIKQKYPHETSISFFIYLYELERQNFEASKEYAARPVWERFEAGEYYRELITIYMAYMENLANPETVDEALEKLLITITAFCELYPQDIEGWILLHCLYRNNNYLPGMEFTRWKFENLYEKQYRPMPPLPLTRWQILFNYPLQLKTQKGAFFSTAIERLVSLGMYNFAEIIFQSIANQCTDIERYLMTSTFKVLQNNVDPKYAVKTFAADKMINGEVLKAFQYQVNGSLDFIRGKTDAAMKSYGNILRTRVTDFKDFQLGLLRYGFHMMDTKEYEHAAEAFNKFQDESDIAMMANINLGKAMYRLHRYDQAIQYFAKSTNFETHTPDVWAYLALIHLKLGHNHKALLCWRYAKLNPKNVISPEILKELEKINIDDICLYVDLINRKKSCL